LKYNNLTKHANTKKIYPIIKKKNQKLFAKALYNKNIKKKLKLKILRKKKIKNIKKKKIKNIKKKRFKYLSI
jgi:hypothetical protein